MSHLQGYAIEDLDEGLVASFSKTITEADICLFTYVDQLCNGGQPLPADLPKVNAWYQRIAQRPSATESVYPVEPMGMRG